MGVSSSQLGLFPAPAAKARGAWGGARPGAGRKKKTGPTRRVPHRARPVHRRYQPVHVTLRARGGLPSFREQVLARVLTAAVAAVKTSPATGASFRVVHFSIQENHLHLMVEAQDASFLSRGMAGLAVRLARSLNRELGVKGRVWRERYHARELTSPREVRNAIVYVLMNAKKHGARIAGLDPYSSARWFDGFRRDAVVTQRSEPPAPSPVMPARTWLGGVGWRRYGLVAPTERPREAG
jgi:REP element-mobilizing transposase RayT